MESAADVTTEPGGSGPVVVAVGGEPGGQAVDWAAAEASARRCRLHVVHAEPLRWTVDPTGLVPVADFSAARADAEAALGAAVRRARAVAPGTEISAEAVVGSVVPVLVSRGRGAQLLVVGSRTAPFPRGLRGALAPSVGDRVAGRAPCPVASIRPLRSTGSVASCPRVVVGVDGSRACAAALGVAFRAAAQRGVPITAVHAWSPDVPVDEEAVPAREAHARLVLDHALEFWRHRFADVPVQTRLVAADPAEAVVRESEGAALTVVGCRGRGRVRAALFGSVSRTVVQRARCPVVVVGSDAARRDSGAGRRRTGRLVDPAGAGRQPRQPR